MDPVAPALAQALTTLETGQLGARLKAARLAQGLTQPQLADGIYSSAALSRIERGSRRPKLASLQRLCERLGVSLESLVYGPHVLMRAEPGSPDAGQIHLSTDADREPRWQLAYVCWACEIKVQSMTLPALETAIAEHTAAPSHRATQGEAGLVRTDTRPASTVED